MIDTFQMVSVPCELLEQALDAAAAVGMQDVADELNRLLNPSTEHQGEPVAYQWRRKTVRVDSQWDHWVDCTDEDYRKTIDNPGPTSRGIIREARKLYTHADPGEVERLRAENEQLREVIKHSDANILRQSQRIDNLRREVAELRAQAAQRDSLLRECFVAMLKGGYSKPLRERIKASLSASAEPSLPQYHRQPLGMDEAVRARLTLIAREAAISSAHRYNYMPTTPKDAQGWQPHAWVLEALRMVELGAPVERDEHEAFSQACRDAALAKGHELDPQALNRRPNGSHTNELVECGWWGWQARAALECKP